MRPLKKILHIDDDAVMRMMVRKSIERSSLDLEIQTCEGVSDFIEKLGSFAPDLLLIDVVMPVVDGPTLLEKVRRLSISTPAVFMTGQESLDIADRERLEPILGVIHKPFSPSTLGEDLLQYWSTRSIAKASL